MKDRLGFPRKYRHARYSRYTGLRQQCRDVLFEWSMRDFERIMEGAGFPIKSDVPEWDQFMAGWWKDNRKPHKPLRLEYFILDLENEWEWRGNRQSAKLEAA